MTARAVLPAPAASRSPIALLAKIRPVWWGVAGLALVTVAMTTIITGYNVYLYNTLLLAGLGAIALNVLMGTAGQPSIGNSAFLAVGAFSAMFFVRSGIAFPYDIVLCALFGAAVGLVIGSPALRLRGLHLILATLAAYFIVLFLADEYEQHAVGVGGFIITPAFTDKGINGSQQYWAWLLFVLLGVVIVCASYLVRERSGRAWRMIREHEFVAPTLGIRPTRYKLLAFAMSSAVISAEGALTAHLTGAVDVSDFTLTIAIQYIAMILIGGLDSIAGAMIGAAIVTYLPVEVPKLVAPLLGTTRAATDGPNIGVIIYGALIIVFIVGSPRGIVSWLRALRRRLAAWRAGAAAAGPVSDQPGQPRAEAGSAR
jgi:branched-chain amino acid transport system permease protein